MVPPPAAVGPLGVDTSDAEDLDKTPRPHNQTIGHRSSKDSLDKTPRPLHQTIGHQPSIETLNKTPRPFNQTIGHRSSKEYVDKTPRLNNKTISHRSSTETLKVRRANSSSAAAAHITISTATPSAANLNNHNSHYYDQHRPSTSSATSPTSPTTRSASKAPAIIEEPSEGISSKFSLSRKKKKRLQREEEEREEQRLKEEANEAIRRKHGEYHPPGHSQGLVHTHRLPHQHDHHHIERSRSASRLGHKYHQGSVSSSRVVSPEPRSASRASTRSSASSFYTNSRNGSYIHHNGNGSGSGSGNGNGHKNGQGHSRPTSPLGEIVAMPADYFHTHPHMNVLEGLDAESMLSEHEHWDSNSDNEDENLSHYTNRGVRNDRDREEGRESEDRQRKASIDTNSSYRTNGSTSIVWQIPERPLSPSSAASSHHSRSRGHHHPHHQSTMNSISQQIHPDSSKSHHVSLEMDEIGGDGKPNHQSWPLNNMSTTGIVTGLSPEFDGRGEDIIRPHSSMSRYTAGREGGGTKYKDPRVERYLHHARSTSPDNSNIHSSISNHRPHSRHSRHHRHDSNNTNIYPHHDGSDHNNTATSSTAATAAELLRAKAGSRATNYRPYNHKSSKNGNTDAWSAHETVVSTDEHNYLAPLPPFQQGPAYTRVPKRKFCKFFCGGCRWWVLLLIILIPAGLIAVATAFLLHWFRVCIAIDPNTVEPIIYTIDPATVQGISLDYQTRTKGVINIVDSPSLTETRVIMKLRRQFYNMKDRQDLTGFKVSTLDNGFSRFVMDDEANQHREFFISSVLCSDSILTIEMPRPKPLSSSSSSANYTQEIGLDILLDQQDVLINLDQTLHRNATYKFRGVSNRNMVVQSLNINALSISYTSNSNAPASVVLQSVIVRDQLAVMSVSGDINATVGFSAASSWASSSSGSGGSGSTTPTTVNLNTLDGQIRLDISKGWNQSSTFQIDSPDIQLSKAGNIILPFGGSHNRTDVSVNGLKASEGQHSLTGTFKPQGEAPTPAPPRVTGTATTKPSSATPTATMTAPAPTMPPGGSALGAGGSLVPAQLMIQANKNVAINFP
ncbi:hypothetical protein BKA57DRAFT_470171 [Linnemannia elongata]|nr:hypothetical protein BKA57DRAFT_470171 [Linnemannia elongata]